MRRRSFLKTAGGAFILSPLSLSLGNCSQRKSMPSYLKGYEVIYDVNPHQAAMQWFKDAKFGLFIHYGLYSLLGRHEWVMYDEKIPVSEYNKLKDQFTAEQFDADFITNLALEAQMKYINLVTKHCDSFCLWDTKCTDFNSVNSPAKRDLVSEMAKACEKKGLGFFVFYEHGFDWRHPDGPRPEEWKNKAARPDYKIPEPSYHYGEDYNFQRYLDYINCGITELLTRYGPVAGVWLDGVAIPRSGDRSLFKCEELYALIRKLQKQTLISYKYGLTGDEDFMAPEEEQLLLDSVDLENRKKLWEICTCMQDGGSTPHKYGWGYVKDANHFSSAEIMKRIDFAWSKEANILLNVGPLGDGSIHKKDIDTLLKIGKILISRKN